MKNRITKSLILLMVVFSTLLMAQGTPPFLPPLPEPGTAVVDGNIAEWDISSTSPDWFADMYEAGNPTKEVLSKCYLRYDCNTFTLFVLVLVEDGVTADLSAGNAWVKIYDLAESPQVDGNSTNFAWLASNRGYEASFGLAEAYYNEIEVHLSVTWDGESGRTSSTGKKSNPIPLNVNCGLLPVELTSFSVSINNDLAQLNWETATEVNNYGFEVERTSENNDWSKLGFVEGHGNSNSPKYYSFIDNSLNESGKYSYRLKQIDIDGTYVYSDVVNIDLSAPAEFKLNQNYPNPFNPTTSINYSISEDSYVELIVYDILGNKVAVLEKGYKAAGLYNRSFDASNLSSGLYFYTIKAGNYSSTMKMLLMR